MLRAFLIILCVQATRSDSFLPNTKFGDIFWLLGNSSLGQTKACAINDLLPTPRTMEISWNEDIMSSVTKGLGKMVYPLNGGVFGCCVPSLWCDSERC